MTYRQERDNIRLMIDLAVGSLPHAERCFDYAVGLLQVQRNSMRYLDGELYPVMRKWLGDITGATVADLGCANGLFLPWLAGQRQVGAGQAPARIVAVDDNPVLLKLAALNSPGPRVEFHQVTLGARQTDLSAICGPNGFDRVVLSNVLPYLDDRGVSDTLAHLAEMQPRGGVMTVSFLHARWITFMNLYGDCPQPEDQFKVITRHSLGSAQFHCRPAAEWYEPRFREAGFEITDSYQVQGTGYDLSIPMYQAHRLVRR